MPNTLAREALVRQKPARRAVVASEAEGRIVEARDDGVLREVLGPVDER
jgi:hypothetical protein